MRAAGAAGGPCRCAGTARELRRRASCASTPSATTTARGRLGCTRCSWGRRGSAPGCTRAARMCRGNWTRMRCPGWQGGSAGPARPEPRRAQRKGPDAEPAGGSVRPESGAQRLRCGRRVPAGVPRSFGDGARGPRRVRRALRSSHTVPLHPSREITNPCLPTVDPRHFRIHDLRRWNGSSGTPKCATRAAGVGRTMVLRRPPGCAEGTRCHDSGVGHRDARVFIRLWHYTAFCQIPIFWNQQVTGAHASKYRPNGQNRPSTW